jgi:hypothetical protein
MSKKEIDGGNIFMIAIVLWLTYYCLQDASNIFEVLIIFCAAFLGVVFGRMKNHD